MMEISNDKLKNGHEDYENANNENT